jgi:outer membrane protein
MYSFGMRLALALLLAAGSAHAVPLYKRLYARGGVARIEPLTQSHALELSNVSGPASLAVANGPIAGSGAALDGATVPALIVGFALDDHFALETVLGAPFTVTFRATGTLATQSIGPMALGIPTGVPPIGSELGSAKAAPPLLTMIYKLGHGAVRPYGGLGASVLVAYDARVTNPVLTSAGAPTFHVSPAPGLVLQSGVDVRISEHVYARADVKFIALMEARAHVDDIRVHAPEIPLLDPVKVGSAEMTMWVNPLIVQLAVGADF